MKLTTTLLLSCLVVSIIASTTNEKLRAIAKTQFGKTLLDTIQLELKTSNKADPRPRILQLLKEIQDEANQAISSLNDEHDQRSNQCSANEQQYEQQIAEYQSQIADAQNQISQKQQQLANVVQDRDSNQATLDTLEPYLAQITDRRQQQQQDFEEQDNKRSQLIAVLERTRQYITDRLDARQSEGAFLEKENVLLSIKNTVTSSEFKKVSAGWGQIISLLATKALNKLKTPEDDQAVSALQSIVDLLNGIIAETNGLRVDAQASNDEQVRIYEEARATIEQQIGAAQNLVSSAELDITAANDQIAALQASIDVATNLLQGAKDSLASNERDCDEYEANYQENITNRQQELELIKQVIAIVQNDLTGLNQNLEDAINNSSIVVE